ncbi:sulfurtransferase [Pseudothauera nasutitermitis]|uniref:Sulfurtransferase n=1 Tax=Pseudothauera nasutitermitis TaxID=2565930 RepID=A0A4V3WB58_9RHOO|nr:rhodanese-like domain-containing protein [Pseudothauera nasutitermitis]THF61932.1 sulfurtransferase [Pseudothauera nasutitermitis]
MQEMTPAELAARLADPPGERPLLLDVREPWEFQYCHIDGSLPLPMSVLPARIAELDPARETVVICHHGMRSAQVCRFLEHQGFARVINLSGGVAAWAERIDPRMPQY